MLDGIHITRWGSEGPTLLMIHGGPQGGPAGGAEHWAAQRPLADELPCTLVLPDRPGHGASPSRGAEDMETDAGWVAALAGELGRVHLVGHSYGACVALVAAARRPTTVASLTLVEAPVFSAARYDPGVRAVRAELAGLLRAELDPISLLIEFSRATGIPPGGDGTRLTPEQAERMGAGLATMRQPMEWDARIVLAQVARARIPLLAVTGGWSPGFDAVGAGLAQATGGDHRVIPSGHHLPHRLADEFNAELAALVVRTETLRSMEL